MIEWTELAKKKLKKLDPVVRKRILSSVSNLPHGDIKALSGPLKGYFRLRVGKWRVIFKKFGKNFIIVDIRHRESAY